MEIIKQFCTCIRVHIIYIVTTTYLLVVNTALRDIPCPVCHNKMSPLAYRRRGQLLFTLHIILQKLKDTPAVRSKMLSKLIFASCVYIYEHCAPSYSPSFSSQPFLFFSERASERACANFQLFVRNHSLSRCAEVSS